MFQNYQLLKTRSNLPITEVQFVKNFLYPHEIDALLMMVQNIPFQKANVYGSEGSGMVLRESIIKWVEWNDANWWLYSKIMEKVNDLNNQLWNFDLFGINEFFQYTEYTRSESVRGHYDWHIDVGHHGLASNRKLSFECVLDDDYTGGEFAMLIGPTEHRVRLSKGDAVVYPSFLLNKIYPVSSGSRKSLVSWISGPSFK